MAGFKRLPVLSEKDPQQELGRTQNTLDNLQSCVSTRHFNLFYYIYLFVCLFACASATIHVWRLENPCRNQFTPSTMSPRD